MILIINLNLYFVNRNFKKCFIINSSIAHTGTQDTTNIYNKVLFTTSYIIFDI